MEKTIHGDFIRCHAEPGHVTVDIELRPYNRETIRLTPPEARGLAMRLIADASVAEQAEANAARNEQCYAEAKVPNL